MSKIRVAIAGVGNCASALVQGVEYYRHRAPEDADGLMHPTIGRYGIGDVEFVAAFDIDRRKVGRTLDEAVFAAPNCTPIFQRELPRGVEVLMGPTLDGLAPHMADYPEEASFRALDRPAVDVAEVLRRAKCEVLVCYLPVGAEAAVRHYAEACLSARAGMVNCVPVFIASDAAWAERFRVARLPIVGDDVKSQLGATIVHRVLARLFADRGVRLTRTYQLNSGGNTDFLNMVDRSRLGAKKLSKTRAVQSEMSASPQECDIHIGPSDYVPWLKDNKIAHLRIEGRGFGASPVELEMRLSVQDSPNSAGVVIDALRCVRLALDGGLGGPLLAPSAFYMKSPPGQMTDSEALAATQEFIDAYGTSPINVRA